MNVAPEELCLGLEDAPRGHATVLGPETIALLAPRSDGIYVDATIGGGGHAEALLCAAPGAQLIGLDQDARAVQTAKNRLERFGSAVRVLHGRFSEVEQHLASLGIDKVDGLIADLGISSLQLSDPERGLSFRAEGPLDMRMDPSSGATALDVISELGVDDLANAIYQYGEERRSRRIARCIKQALDAGELCSTLDLRRAIVRAVGPARTGGIDPATRTFQALRIAVNHELDELSTLLESSVRVLAGGAVVAIVSFHSLEDRLVKRAFLDRWTWQRLTPKPVVASRTEMEANPRSRSAKLRAAKRGAA
jgi:16S rRNA (cytosine1402-N4)-methyltransferase